MSSSGTDEQSPEFRVTFKSIEQSLTIPFVNHFPLWASRLENDEDGTTTFQGGLIRSDPGDLVLNGEYASDAEKVYRFQPRESDIWVTSFPKCGKFYNSSAKTFHKVIGFANRNHLDAGTCLVIN